jgi:flagellar hook-basal body protein
MSFYTSLTGLNGAQADISTTSNNVANVGTTGFKRSRAEFGDIFATSPLQNASSAIGSGTILKSIKQQFTQGNIQSSLNALDLAITGQGFFAMKPSLTSSQTVYTRNGSFSVNNDRYVVDSKGQYLQVFPVNDDGSVTSTSADSAKNLQLPVNSGLPAATEKIELGLNLPADAEIIPQNSRYSESNPYIFNRDDPDTFNKSTSITIYDSLGNPTIATIYYVKTSNATETTPSNKWQTYVYVGANELDPALIAAKDEQGQTLYINKFGQTTSDPQSLDPTFVPGAPHPLYKLDEQSVSSPSSPARVTGVNIRTGGFDFGETDSTEVIITNDPDEWGDTREGGFTDAGAKYWGENMFTISDGNSEPVSISIKSGKYTGTSLAVELTRAVNEAFGDDRYVKITDTYINKAGSVVPGNDIIKIDLISLDEQGNDQGLSSPIEIDLLGTDGSQGTPLDGTASGLAAPERDLQLTRTELIDTVQKRLNAAMNNRGYEFGKESVAWVEDNNPSTWPITVGYDKESRSLTFAPNRTLIGPNANELQARFNSLQVFSPTASNLGLPLKTTSTPALIRAGTSWSGGELVPDGDYLLDPNDHRFGIEVKYNKDSRQFSFISGVTGEDSSIRVGRAALATEDEVQTQIDSYDLSDVSLAEGEAISIQVFGKTFTYVNTSSSDLSGTGLVSGIIAAYEADHPSNVSEEQEVTFSLTGATLGLNESITVDGVSVALVSSDTETTILQKVKAALETSASYGSGGGQRLVAFDDDDEPTKLIITFGAHEGDARPIDVTIPSDLESALEPAIVVETVKGKDLIETDFVISNGSELEIPPSPLTRLLITGASDGSRFSSTLRINGEIKVKEAVGATGSHSVPGVELGSAIFSDTTSGQVTEDSPYLGSSNDLLGVGTAYDTQALVVSGTGLVSTPAVATGTRAIAPLNQTFVPNETLGENLMTFTVDGIVGTITLPVRAYTGDTFASAIQERVNQIEDEVTGRTVSGVRVQFDVDNNRLVFTSGTKGRTSQINVVGHPNYGLRNVSVDPGKVPIITNLKQATDADDNKLFINENGEIITQDPGETQNWFPLYLDQGELTFDTFGKLDSPKEGVIYSPFDPANGSNLINLAIDYGKFSTQFSQPFSVLSLQQDGYPSGRLDGLNIDANGTVRANYTNGRTEALGKLILANFANPNGLKQVGNANYVATSVSGDASLGQAGGDGFGSIQSGSLERSNVDITEELVNLITAQRNFQANAKAIETTTTLTQTIIQIRG